MFIEKKSFSNKYDLKSIIVFTLCFIDDIDNF